MAHENEVKTEPDDKLIIGAQIFPLEGSTDYIDDPQAIYARDDTGAAIRVI
jgi:hypothetical protein